MRKNSRFKTHFEVEVTELNKVVRKKRAIGYYLWFLPGVTLQSVVPFMGTKIAEIGTVEGVSVQQTCSAHVKSEIPCHPPHGVIR